jgi:hypothetical protein
VRHDVKENTETATRKDAQPVEKVNSTQQSHPKIVKPAVVLMKTNSTVPQGNKTISEKQKNERSKNILENRDTIWVSLSRILSLSRFRPRSQTIASKSNCSCFYCKATGLPWVIPESESI